MRTLCGSGLLVCALTASGCGDAPRAKEAAPQAGADQGNPGLLGEWRWVKSERGSEVVRPAGPGDSTVVEIGAWGRYREYTRGSALQGHYKLAEGRMYQTDDTAFTVLVLDSSRFFGGPPAQPPSVAVRAMAGDSLVLSGTGTDTSVYTFVRAGGPR